MKKIFVIDWWLSLVFALTVYSGFKLHVAGHFSTHDVWHNWAVCHSLSGLMFIILGVLYVQTHWGWYKSLIAKGLGKKSRTTACLSLIYVAAIVTGIVLLLVDGAGSGVGLWHYRLGIILAVVGVLHFIKRFSVLKRGTRK